MVSTVAGLLTQFGPIAKNHRELKTAKAVKNEIDARAVTRNEKASVENVVVN
jgi:hypothetical protein